MSKEIVFYAANPATPESSKPLPGSKVIPSYYKKIRSPSRHNPIFDESKRIAVNVKACMPYRDALTAGYIMQTWCDIYIDNGMEGEVEYFFSDPLAPIMGHRAANNEMLETLGRFYYPFEFYWISQWEVRLPRGYSLLVTQPMNRLDLPFVTTSGVVDSDVFTFGANQGTAAQIPFYIRKGFTGLIPAGTPIYQLVPIRRDTWVSTFLRWDEGTRGNTYELTRRYFTGGYLRHFWNRKEYR